MTSQQLRASVRSACAVLLIGLIASCVDPPEPGTQPLTNNVTDWRDEVIYQVLIDRFADGNPANNFNVNPDDPSAYHGGDWKGLQDKLPYLQELGVTSLWISPVVKNVEEDAGFSSYHGYWTQDFTRPNPHFGDLIALREMVDAAHGLGMTVILDVVTNHVGQAFYYDINKNGSPDEFFIGQGGRVIPLEQGDAQSDLVRVIEWDPDFDINGVQAWTSLGPSGPAPVKFVNYPEINRVAPEPAIFSSEFAYNRKGRVTVWTDPEVCGCESWGCPWDNPCRREQETLGDFPGGLKDIATQEPAVRDAMFEVFAKWIQVGDFDGFRIDTLKHVEQGFWEDFCPRIRAWASANGKENFLMFGEAFDGDDSLLGYYTQGQGVDSVFYFSQYYIAVRNAFLGDGHRTCEVARLQCRRLGCDADPCGEVDAPIPALYNSEGKTGGPVGEEGEGLNAQQLVINFISNHDVGRLLFFMPDDWGTTERRSVLQLALGYLLATDGIPSLYYGVEQEFSGGNDPGNRENMWRPETFEEVRLDGGIYKTVPRTYDSDGDGRHDTVWKPWNTTNPTFLRLKSLIAARKANIALRRGDFKILYSTAGSGGSDHGIFAFQRQHPAQTAVVVMNLGLEKESRTSNDSGSMVVDLPAGTTVVDLIDPSNTWVLTSEGCESKQGQSCLDAILGPKSIQILIPSP